MDWKELADTAYREVKDENETPRYELITEVAQEVARQVASALISFVQGLHRVACEDVARVGDNGRQKVKGNGDRCHGQIVADKQG